MLKNLFKATTFYYDTHIIMIHINADIALSAF